MLHNNQFLFHPMMTSMDNYNDSRTTVLQLMWYGEWILVAHPIMRTSMDNYNVGHTTAILLLQLMWYGDDINGQI